MIPKHDIKSKKKHESQISLIDGDRFAEAHLNFGNHRHSFYELLWIKGGAGIHQIDFIDYQIGNNTFYFLSPGQIHNLANAIIDDAVVLIFDEDFAHKLSDNINVLRSLDLIFNQFPVLNLSTVGVEQINHTIRILEIELNKNDSSKDIQFFALNLLLFQILYLSNQKGEAVDNPSKIWKKRYYDFLELIEANFAKEHSVAFYANQLNIHPKRLNEVSKTVTGENAQFLIQKRLVTEAKRLLFYSNSSIKEIAYQLGFEDVSYFSKWFQKNIGMRPSTFQESNPETTT